MLQKCEIPLDTHSFFLYNLEYQKKESRTEPLILKKYGGRGYDELDLCAASGIGLLVYAHTRPRCQDDETPLPGMCGDRFFRRGAGRDGILCRQFVRGR